MVKHNIASSRSAEFLCQKMPRNVAVAERLKNRKVTRSFTLAAILWKEMEYVAIDSGYGTIEDLLKEIALDSLDAVEEARTGKYAQTRS